MRLLFSLLILLVMASEISTANAKPTNDPRINKILQREAEYRREKEFDARVVHAKRILNALAPLKNSIGKRIALTTLGPTRTTERTILEQATLRIGLRTSNSEFDTEAGEPNPQGKMKRTFWRRLTVTTPSRIVLHTYGSEIDTALAVYSGKVFSSLKRIAFSDDTSIVGGDATSSLVTFDAVPGTLYNIQVGSKTGAVGDVRLDAFILPAAGGITAFLFDGIPAGTFPGADWVCGLGSGGLSSCPSPVFLLHNATDKTVTIRATSPLGTGSIPPPSFTLKSGETVLKSFTFSGSFDTATLRSLSGFFEFTAKSAGKIVGTARVPALLTVFGFDTSGVNLKLHTVPLIESSTIGGFGAFPVEIVNEGTSKAVGCQFSQLFDTSFNVTWYRYNPATQALLPQLNPIFDIKPGEPLYFVVGLVSDVARLGDDNNTVRVQCTNAEKFAAQIPDAYSFNMANLASFESRLMPLPDLKGDVLKVPGTGKVYNLEFTNDGAAVNLKLSANVVAPTGDTSNSRFTAFVCQSDATDSQCLKSTASTVAVAAPAKKRFTVKVAVKRSSVDPGFDPELRRLVVTLKENLSFFGSTVSGQHSVALEYQ
jgi:hypothetical protein